MAETRKSLTRTLYLNGALALAVLTVLVHLLLRWATTQSGAADAGYEVLVGTLVFLGVAGAGSFAFFRWVVARLIRPLDSAELIASRVAVGNLAVSDLSIAHARRNGGQVLASLGAMVESLRALTSAIQGAAAEAAKHGASAGAQPAMAK